ncbi:MAG TPA: HupE/UreJ family protein, partial [Candidatus Limnocylindria bacterium]|nr:HupE/UreJ family protein [Candidatus Limnocylindria bacterium]
MISRARPNVASCLLVAAGLALSFAPLRAHDIPSDVIVRMFLKPDGNRAQLLVRAPLAAMNELEWPARGVFLDLERAEPVLREAATRWVADRIDLYEEDRRLPRPRLVAFVASLPSDTSFDDFDRARTHITGAPLPADTEVATAQVLLDVVFEYPIENERSRLSVATRFESTGLRSTTTLRLLPPGGPERAFQFHGDPGVVPLDPRWFQAAWRFVVDGFFHILGGVDHLLFLLCLVIPFRRIAALVPIVTSFTIAHSITLIAASIVYMALENIISPALRRRWMITFGFGLVHGFGFSFALRDSLQFAGNHLLTSLLSFNVGVEVGQLVVLVLAVPALELLFRYGVAERMGTIVLSALIAHTGWHWLTERGATLARFRFEWPIWDAMLLAALLQWLIVAVALAGAA